MSRRTGVQLMSSSAVYQQFVRRSVRLAMTRAALCRRATWMECWMASPTSADEPGERFVVRVHQWAVVAVS